MKTKETSFREEPEGGFCMKNRTKLLLSLVLTLVLILGLPLTAHAEDQSGKCGDDLNWTLHSDTGVLHITGSGENKVRVFV